ncbi:hypothetical protein W03_15840 [Nitrosomonas sp. PY1]|nr:hypothetical protein W03_15840 [Nitrosomonas sp. PY1]
MLVVLSLFFLSACASNEPYIKHNTKTEEVINEKDLPPKVSQALSKEYSKEGLVYKRKRKDGVTGYVIEYKKDKEKFAIAYSEDGKLLKEEKEIEFSDIPRSIRTSVDKKISSYYPGYKIISVEKAYIHQEMLLEIVFSHPESETGLVEAAFGYRTGTFREFINIKMESIETLY